MKFSVTIDVPLIEAGLRFYRDALGIVEVSRPIPTYVTLDCGGSEIGLMEKPAGTVPAKGSDDVRRYERHWTPVHIDFHVENFEEALAKVSDACAKCENKFAIHGRTPIACCSNQFGNGYCIL